MLSKAVPAGVQSKVRTASRFAGIATASARMLPSFLVVGAQRAGTTSLFKALVQHPAVLPPVLHKGVHYFDTCFDRGVRWYQGHFPLTLVARLKERNGVLPITGESSPYYMFHPRAPERIASSLPEIKLIVLLRDPVERAYSAHTHELARGFETEPFEKAVELEPIRLAGEAERISADPEYYSHHHQHSAYLARGRYVDQLERLESVVGGDRLSVVQSEEFFEDPVSVYHEVVDFLGLPRWQPPRFDRHNARQRAQLPNDLRRRLEDHFEPYDERLAAWLGKTPGWRR